MPLSSFSLRGVFLSVFLLAGACASSTPPENVVCRDSDIFRLAVDTSPIPDMLHEARTPDAPASVPIDQNNTETAIFNAMTTADPREHTYRPRNIAVLSGGGEFGAFGAGFFQSYLKGKDIHFDVVTGVSTGALQATGVFLGGEEDLEGVVDGYTINRETDLAIERRSFAGLPLENSIYNLDPARARYDRFLTDERIERVAAAARSGRKLLVGVVEVQDGQFYAFDLTAIAASSRPIEERRQCYIEAVFASAAVPVVFPPVLLDNRQYFDGGVRAAVFLDTTIAALGAMKPEYAAQAKVYVLFNGYLDTPHQNDLAVSLTDAVARTRTIAFDQIDRTSLINIAALADRFDIAWTRIEPGLCQEERARAPDAEIFNPPFMACLIREGREKGAGPAPFMKIR